MIKLKLKKLTIKKILVIYPKCFITNLLIWTINSGVDNKFWPKFSIKTSGTSSGWLKLRIWFTREAKEE